MNPARNLLAWTCVALVILPMPPCALLPDMCGGQAKAAESEAPPARSCCADAESASHSPQRDTSHGKPSTPCERGCCRLNDVAPLAEKTVAEPSIAWLPVLAPVAVESLECGSPSLSRELLPPVASLQSLHCLWRC